MEATPDLESAAQPSQGITSLAEEDLTDKVGFYLHTKHGTVWEIAHQAGKLLQTGFGEELLFNPLSATLFQCNDMPLLQIQFEQDAASGQWVMHHLWNGKTEAAFPWLAGEAVTGEVISAYVGDYASAELNVTFQIGRQNDKLQLIRRRYQKELKLVHRALLTDGDFALQIMRDPQDQVIGFHLMCIGVRHIHFVKVTG